MFVTRTNSRFLVSLLGKHLCLRASFFINISRGPRFVFIFSLGFPGFLVRLISKSISLFLFMYLLSSIGKNFMIYIYLNLLRRMILSVWVAFSVLVPFIVILYWLMCIFLWSCCPFFGDQGLGNIGSGRHQK